MLPSVTGMMLEKKNFSRVTLAPEARYGTQDRRAEKPQRVRVRVWL